MKNKITDHGRFFSISVNDTISLDDGLEIGGYGCGQDGSQKIGGRRTNWSENKTTKEVDEIDVARRFSSLTVNGLTKFEKHSQNSDVDVCGMSDNKQIVENFQITRLWDEQFWKELNAGAVDKELSLEKIAELILLAVKRKGENKYTHSRRKIIILLIDTNPVAVIPELIDKIKNCLGTRVSYFGFKSVWLVGTNKEHIFKLSY